MIGCRAILVSRDRSYVKRICSLVRSFGVDTWSHDSIELVYEVRLPPSLTELFIFRIYSNPMLGRVRVCRDNRKRTQRNDARSNTDKKDDLLLQWPISVLSSCWTTDFPLFRGCSNRTHNKFARWTQQIGMKKKTSNSLPPHRCSSHSMVACARLWFRITSTDSHFEPSADGN